MEYHPPGVLPENKLTFKIWGMVGGRVLRAKDKSVIGVDRTELIPVMNYFKISPEDSSSIFKELDTIAKIIYGGK